MKINSLVLFDWKSFQEDIRSFCESKNPIYDPSALKYLQSFVRMSKSSEKIFQKDYPFFLGQIISETPKDDVFEVYFFSLRTKENCYGKFLKEIS